MNRVNQSVRMENGRTWINGKEVTESGSKNSDPLNIAIGFLFIGIGIGIYVGAKFF